MDAPKLLRSPNEHDPRFVVAATPLPIYDRRRMAESRPVRLHESFNRSGFSRFINGGAGRAFRLAAGAAFLVVGWVHRAEPLGKAAMVWSFFPLTAGAFDLCWISAALGGPLSGRKIRAAGTS